MADRAMHQETDNTEGAPLAEPRLDGPFYLKGIAPAEAWAAWLQLAQLPLGQPQIFARRCLAWMDDLAAAGRGEVRHAPPRGDRRFADPAWSRDPAYRALAQGYLAGCHFLYRLVEDADLDAGERSRLSFFAGNLAAALAPTNWLAGNPAAQRQAVESGGASLVRGWRNRVDDLRRNGGWPAQVDKARFRVGENLAATPGSVVWRSPVLELIQYEARQPRVGAIPLLVVPPLFNKYYFVDLSPGRSLVEYLVAQGVQVFIVSWRNPQAEHAAWNTDTYAEALIGALDAALDIAAAPRANLCGVCGGTRVLAPLLGYLAQVRPAQVGAVSLLIVNVMAQSAPQWPDDPNGTTDRDAARRGVMRGGDLARTFSLHRPGDLIWNYWVDSYLLGRPVPAIDLLYWNNDSTNIPAALRLELIRAHCEGRYAQPGGLAVLGRPIDLARLGGEYYVVAGAIDHLNPWRDVYATGKLFNGTLEFVLSATGHIHTIVNPPGGRGRYLCGGATGGDADAWQATAREEAGSWWPHWAAWLGARSGPSRPAPRGPGNARHPPLCAAPGQYVHESWRAPGAPISSEQENSDG